MSRWKSADKKLKRFLRKFEKSKKPEEAPKHSFLRRKKKKKEGRIRLPPVVTPVILRPKKTASLEALQLKYDSGNATLIALLHTACMHNNVEEIEALLDEGVKADIALKGLTPLFTACQAGSLDAAKSLIEHGAEVNEECNGFTPYHMAAVNGHKHIMELLVTQHNVDPLSVCTNGTALQLACERGRCDIIKWLVEKHKAEVNPETKITRSAELAATAAFNGTHIAKQVSPLVAAAFGGSAPAVRLLLQYGADLTYDGNKAISVAHSKGHIEVLHVLIQESRMRVNPTGHVNLIPRGEYEQSIWRLFYPKSLQVPNTDIARHESLVEIMKTWTTLPDGAKLLHMLEKGGFEIPEYTAKSSTEVFAEKPDYAATLKLGDGDDGLEDAKDSSDEEDPLLLTGSPSEWARIEQKSSLAHTDWLDSLRHRFRTEGEQRADRARQSPLFSHSQIYRAAIERIIDKSTATKSDDNTDQRLALAEHSNRSGYEPMAADINRSMESMGMLRDAQSRESRRRLRRPNTRQRRGRRKRGRAKKDPFRVTMHTEWNHTKSRTLVAGIDKLGYTTPAQLQANRMDALARKHFRRLYE